MFKINQRPQFLRKVDIPVPADQGHEAQSIDVTFRALPEKDLVEFNTLVLDGQKDLLRRVVANITDIVDDAGAPLPFTAELLDELMDWSFARLALMRAYAEAIAEARVGN